MSSYSPWNLSILHLKMEKLEDSAQFLFGKPPIFRGSELCGTVRWSCFGPRLQELKADEVLRRPGQPLEGPHKDENGFGWTWCTKNLKLDPFFWWFQDEPRLSFYHTFLFVFFSLLIDVQVCLRSGAIIWWFSFMKLQLMEEEIPFGNHHFQVPCEFSGVYTPEI